MTTLDIILLIVFVVSVALGFRKGMIVQAGSLGGIILGVLLCHIFGDRCAAMIAGAGEAPTYVDCVLANIIMFVVGYLSVRAVAHFCKQLTHALALGGLTLGGQCSAFPMDARAQHTSEPLADGEAVDKFSRHVDPWQRPRYRSRYWACPRAVGMGGRMLEPMRDVDCCHIIY